MFRRVKGFATFINRFYCKLKRNADAEFEWEIKGNLPFYRRTEF